MGISGLLPLLKDIQVSGHISDFRGKTLAVDAYVWLHKGAFGCAEDLVKGRKTTKFVDYAMHRVRMLRYHGVTPYIVFDGGPLPAKKGTEVSRAKSRAENLERARSFEAQGRYREARDYYTRCLDITPEMAYQLIKALRAESVDYVVAPYEADAQLCFLEKEGFVDGIITEDSDLLVFGCRQVVYKLDGDGHCVHIHRDKLATIREFPMHGWTDVQFRRMAMLSGCDYLDSIPGIGLKTAHRLMRRFHTVEKLLQHVRLEGTMPIPPTYLADFAQAELAFIHQRVFDPHQGRLVPLNDFPEGGLQEMDERWVGLDLAVELAKGLARGDIHPATLEVIVDEWPDFKPVARSKPVLGNSSKGNTNIGGGAGPMDAFITRSKRPKSLPLPRPVGMSTSGPSRLSDQVMFSRSADSLLQRRQLDQDDNRPVKKSKFFAAPAKRAPKAEQEVELKWEESDEEPTPGPSRTRSPSVRSPSPAISSIRAEDSPAKSLFSDAHILTSPQGPMISSPACSSPRSMSPERSRHTRSATPPSPTCASAGSSVLVEASSQVFGASQSVRSSQIAQTPIKRSRPISRLASIIIPGSSPINASFAPATLSDPPLNSESDLDPPTLKRRGPIHTSSSDSFAEEEVVTPSLDMLGGTQKKRKRLTVKAEPDEEEKDRAERAKIVAQGWRLKYALGSQGSSSPLSDDAQRTVKRSKSDPTPQHLPSQSTPTQRGPLKRSNTSQARPLPLANRPINVPTPVRMPSTKSVSTKPKVQKLSNDSKRQFDKITSPSPGPDQQTHDTEEEYSSPTLPNERCEILVPETQSQLPPVYARQVTQATSSSSKLEKYRFVRKVEVE